MSKFKEYQRKGLSEMRPYVAGEDLTNISVANGDFPLDDGGMIARNPLDHNDQWYVARKYFEENLEPVPSEVGCEKSLGNTDINGARKNVKDIVVFGDGDGFALIAKASSENEGWMKSTKAMNIYGHGCLVQVTTQQRNPDGSYAVAEALSFVPDVKVIKGADGHRKIVRIA